MAIAVMLTACMSLQAQKVDTGHPDFKVKVTRCEASGKTVVIDMLWENTGSKDVYITCRTYGSSAYDDEGNKFSGNGPLKIMFGNNGYYKDDLTDLLPSDLPVKVRLQIKDVPVSATMFRRVDINIYSNEWGGLDGPRILKLTNIPISHEGD